MTSDKKVSSRAEENNAEFATTDITTGNALLWHKNERGLVEFWLLSSARNNVSAWSSALPVIDLWSTNIEKMKSLRLGSIGLQMRPEWVQTVLDLFNFLMFRRIVYNLLNHKVSRYDEVFPGWQHQLPCWYMLMLTAKTSSYRYIML